MTMHEADEELRRAFASLRVHQPDAARQARVRARCHAALTARHAQAKRRRRRHDFIVRVAEAALLGGLSASYLLAIVFVLLRLHGVL